MGPLEGSLLGEERWCRLFFLKVGWPAAEMFSIIPFGQILRKGNENQCEPWYEGGVNDNATQK